MNLYTLKKVHNRKIDCDDNSRIEPMVFVLLLVLLINVIIIIIIIPNQDKIRTLRENETYKYLGIWEADTIK